MKRRIVLYVCGVCGAGKTSVGRELADDLSAAFLDADDFHPPANLDKLRRSIPLSDDDRTPWLERVADAASAAATPTEKASDVVVVACSALKASYRDALRRRRAAGCEVEFILLDPPEEALRARLSARHASGAPGGHPLPDAAAALKLLPSQLAALERGGDWAVVVEGDMALVPAREVAREVARRLRQRWGGGGGGEEGGGA